jgi:hypothetical protein
LSYITIISLSETKTFWYLAPCYLFAAFIIVLGWFAIQEIVSFKDDKRYTIAFRVGLIAMFSILYFQIVSENINPSRELLKDEKYGVFIKQFLRPNTQLNTFTLIDNNFGSAAFFYKKKYEYENPDISITYQRSTDVEIGTNVVTCLQNVLNPLRDKYEYEVHHRWTDCKLLKITSIKSNELNQTQD